jgi:hypothetical protein
VGRLLRQGISRRFGFFSGPAAHVTCDRLLVALPFLQRPDGPDRPHFSRQISPNDCLPPPPLGPLKSLVRLVAIDNRLECKLSCRWCALWGIFCAVRVDPKLIKKSPVALQGLLIL